MSSRRTGAVWIVAAFLLAFGGCEQNGPSTSGGTAAPVSDPTPATRPTADVAPTPHPTVDGSTAPPLVEFDAANRSTLTFTGPEGWIEENPESSMRTAQFRLPGDGGDASVVVFYFGSYGAGTVQENIDRWCNQFEVPSGVDPVTVAKTGEHTVGGMIVYDIDLAGTYVAETRPGSGERVNEPGWRLRGSILLSPAGPYYVKMIGPEATVAANITSFDEYVTSAGR